MTGLRSKRRGIREAAILAFTAALLFVAAPILVEHHHHANPLDSAHCALCVFASGHVTRPPAPPTVAPQLTLVVFLRTTQESLPASPPANAQNKRAPPLV